MDFQYLLDIVLRRKWLVVLAGLVPAIATFVYFSMQDRQYKSDALISTGIIGAGLNLEEERAYVQDVMLSINFGTRLEKLKGPSMKRLLAYQMLLHDLSGKQKPFRTFEEPEEIKASDADIRALLKEIQPRLDTLNARVLPTDHEKVFKEVSKALEYDFESFDDNIIAYRKGDTDFIAAEYASEDPYLSAYLINQLVEIYIRLNKFEQEKEYIDDYDFAKKIAEERRTAFDLAKSNLNLYLQNRTVVDLDVQSQELVKRIEKLEEERNRQEANIEIAQINIAEINSDLQRINEDRKGIELSTILDNEDVVRLRNQHKNLLDQYFATQDETYQKQANLVQKQIDAYMRRDAERDALEQEDYILDLTKTWEESRQEWKLEKNKAEKSLASIEAELAVLNDRRSGIVTDQAQVDRLQSALDIAEEEYEEAKHRLNETKTRLDKSYQPLQVIEYAQIADEPESSGRVLFTLFSGVLGSGFCMALLFLLAFFDISLNNPHQFKKFTNLPLVGTINELKRTDIDLSGIFNSNGKREDLLMFKEAIRNIRYAMEQSGGKTFLFASTQDQVGKTFLMITLAYAMTLKRKKVLLIDTNFKNNTLTQMSEKAQRKNLLTTKLIGKNKLEDDFESKSVSDNKFSVDHVDIIGNRGGYNSPGEIFAGKDFKQFIEDLAQNYDYVFLEGAALNTYTDTKELTEFADKVVVVFSAESTISDADKKSMRFFKQLNNKLLGAVLNKLDLENVS